jgi:Family of unknown function (DUF6325)
MAYGPIELLALQFRGPQLDRRIIPALRDLTERDVVRIVDVAIVSRDKRGDVKASEVADLDQPEYAELAPLVHELSGLLSDEDLIGLGESMEPGSTAGVFLLEHHWATRLDREVRRFEGTLMLHLRIPRETVEIVRAARRKALR